MWNSIRKNIPNFLTSCNLFSGCIATVAALHGHFGYALLFICLGALFDFFDGMVARLLKVSSPIGLQLDSLADDITFGLAPSAIAFSTLKLAFPTQAYVPYTAFLIAVFSALRLAKFNVDTRQTTSFIGLPTPANALFWASLGYHAADWVGNNTYVPYYILAWVVVTSGLLVTELPMFSLKFKQIGWKANKIQYLFLIVCIAILATFHLLGLAICILWYILLSILTARRTPKKEA